jgi:tetratricopeptide (TPR) repeat protein
MYRSSLFLAAAWLGTTVALLQPAAAALTASEVRAIAKAVTVEIKLPKQKDNGSGIIVQKQGDLYTLVTNRHVICGSIYCNRIPASDVFVIELPDGQKYKVANSSIKMLGSSDNTVDLAIIQFRSNQNYPVAKLAESGSLQVEDQVYASGFPCDRDVAPCRPLGYFFGDGKAIAVVDKRLTGDSGGYTIIYDAPTLPGMSGGGVFNGNGELVAIHGYGDRYKENTELENQSKVNSKIGFNRGIPVRWLVQNLAEVGIYLKKDRFISGIRAARSQVSATADEYFITGFNKWVDPGENVLAGKQLAIQEFGKAIQINPKYQYAYYVRAYAYQQVQDFQKSLVDYNQAILLNPKISTAYYNRANLKKDNLNDIEGALADYNQAILLNPKFSDVYVNRANLKAGKLNDIEGALADYNQAILLNPKDSDVYVNRANLKADKLNDFQGALTDYNQAILLNPKDSTAYNNRANLKANKLNDIEGALADYNQTILLNPKDFTAYYNRAILKADKLNDYQGALTDYNQAILLNPKYSTAYYNRANLKKDNLNDVQGSLADYNQAILLNPKYSTAYYNRANLKAYKLNDIQGAVDDYNQAILFNPKYSDVYFNRAILKADKLNDREGAIQDFRQAARLFREQGNVQNLQLAINALQLLGAQE